MIDRETIKRIAAECTAKDGATPGGLLEDFAERLFAEWSKAEPVAWTTKSGSTIISAEAKERLLSKDALGGEFSCAARTAERYVQPLYTRPQPAIPTGWREAIESISEFGDDTLCDEALQSIYASRENTEAALRIAVRLTKQEAIEKLEKLAAVQAQPAIPPVLFDGYAVYQALGNAQARTSPENVSDVLDAVVRLIRAEAQEATK